MTKAISEMTADAGVLLAHLSRKGKGDEVSYSEIETVIGWDVRNNRGIMQTVKNRLLRDHGLTLDPVFKVGYRILTDNEIAEGRLRREREHRRRNAQRAKRIGSTVDISKLDDTQRLKCLAEITAAHVTLDASTDKSVKQIESSLNGSTQPLALNKALDALKHNLK